MNQAALLALLTAVVGTVVYHLAQKQVSPDANPALILVLAYVVGAVLCGLLVLIRFPIRNVNDQQLGWPALGIGVAVVLIEGGFLGMYRTGWSLATGALVVNVLATVVLLGIAVVVFGERPTALQISGAAICLVGLVVMNFQGGV